jgi:hypothetical protein
MNKTFKIIALLGIALTGLAPLLFFFGTIELSLNKSLLLVGMILWIIGATPWLGMEAKESIPGEDEQPHI